MVESAIEAMSPAVQKDPAWVYWRARALIGRQPVSTTAMPQALMALQSIAGHQGFYEQLALEELGQKITLPARPAPATAAELEAAKSHPGLQRAVHAIRIGIRADGVREWNYSVGLVDGQGKRGRMTDRERLAVAQWACELEIWDRCISSSRCSASCACQCASVNVVRCAPTFPRQCWTGIGYWIGRCVSG